VLDRCRELYNAGLQEHRDSYEIGVKGHPNYYDDEQRKQLTREYAVGYYEQKRELVGIKEVRPEYQDIASHVLQDVILRVKRAFDRFFERVKNGQKPGYPRFQGRNRYTSFTYPDEAGWKLDAKERPADKKGMVKVNLVAPFEPMVDIFALSNMAPVPAWTPAKNLAATGTIGDGPYMWSSITPGHQYTVVKNARFDVPGIPRGYADKILYNVNPNVTANAEAVLNNSADVFDPGDTIPASNLPQIKSQASDRYAAMPLNSSWYFWFATYKKPFNNLYARQAVLAALDDRALSRLDSGFQTPDCHLIPFGIVGHSHPSNRPLHNPNGPPHHTMAKQLMAKSGMAGTPVTVYGEERSPRKQYLDYFTSVLNSLGFKATEKVVNSSVYFTTIGAPSLKPTVGFGDWNQDFPNPWDFMELFAGDAGSSLNYGYVNDPYYNAQLTKLSQQTPESVASQWAALDQYAVNKGYYAVYGHEAKPKFYSNRLSFKTGTLSVEYLTDLTSLALNK